MSKKIMTIPEFLEMTRAKENSAERSNKRLYTVIVLFILLAITNAISSELTATDSVIAFSFINTNF